MTKKTVKELDVEVSQLKQDFSDLKSQFDQLSVNYKTLAEEHKKCESPKIPIVKCSTCSLTFPKQKDLQKHMKNDHKCDKKFQCEECERIFVEEWKFKAHEKCHKKYECTICEQTFQSDDIRCKHTKISNYIAISITITKLVQKKKNVCSYMKIQIFAREVIYVIL